MTIFALLIDVTVLHIPQSQIHKGTDGNQNLKEPHTNFATPHLNRPVDPINAFSEALTFRFSSSLEKTLGTYN